MDIIHILGMLKLAFKVLDRCRKGAYFKDDRNFSAFFDPLPPSERKMTPLLLYTTRSLLLILTAFDRLLYCVLLWEKQVKLRFYKLPPAVLPAVRKFEMAQY